MELYPNTAGESVTLLSEEPVSGIAVSVLAGIALIGMVFFNHAKRQIENDISLLSKGIYIVQVQAQSYRSYRKMIKVEWTG